MCFHAKVTQENAQQSLSWPLPLSVGLGRTMLDKDLCCCYTTGTGGTHQQVNRLCSPARLRHKAARLGRRCARAAHHALCDHMLKQGRWKLVAEAQVL